MEAVVNWVKANNCDDENKKKRAIERMSQLGVEYTGGFQSYPGTKPSFKYSKTAAEAKTKKIKSGGYKPFPSYELFIITDIWQTEEVVAEAEEYFFSDELGMVFCKVYVLEPGGILHIFNSKSKEYKVIQIDRYDQDVRNIRAREMVEEAEESRK